MTRLEQLRLDARLTAEQLGAAARVHPRTVYRIERGRGARVSTLDKLAAYFDVPPSDLQREALPVGSAAA